MSTCEKPAGALPQGEILLFGPSDHAEGLVIVDPKLSIKPIGQPENGYQRVEIMTPGGPLTMFRVVPG